MGELTSYPDLLYSRLFLTDGRIIIADVPLSAEVRAGIGRLETKEGKPVVFLDDVDLAKDLEKYLERIVATHSKVLFVFPGNGSNYPRKMSAVWRQFPSADVFAKRMWVPGREPVALSGRILPEVFLVLDVETVVVVDDVICSGATLVKIHEENSWRFPKAKWLGAAWLAQVPQMKAKSGVNGYSSVSVSTVVGKIDGRRIPLNSLSTLKSDRGIAESYANTHFACPEKFLELLNY
ncbi:MAG: hypothetical protein PHV93_01965 [Candidatus Pacebacteria bacterium]|nr:hypothetical protein [Candidatus Paceibacterota bacterium]